MIGKKLVVCMALICLVLIFGEREVSAKIQLAKEDIFFGERTELYVLVSGGGRDSIIDTQSLSEDFSIYRVTDQSRNSESVSIINGQVTRTVFRGHVFVYSLQPKRAGTFTVGPISVTVDGTTIRSNRVVLSVSGTETGNNIFVKTSSPLLQYVVGEVFSISADVYIKGSAQNNNEPVFVSKPPHVSIPWLSNDYKGLETDNWQKVFSARIVKPERIGFYINNIQLQDSVFSMFESENAKFSFDKEFVTTTAPTGEKAAYVKYSIARQFEAKKTGKYTFGGINLQGTIGLPGGARKRVRVAGDSVTIEVVELPMEERPEYFDGAIGDYNIEAKLLSTKANVGDLLDLVVTVRGSGKLDNVLAPKLGMQPQINENYKVYEDNVNVESSSTSKKFQYSVRARRATKVFPPIFFSFFDSKTRKYKTISSTEIPLEIKEVQALSPNEIVKSVEAKKQKTVAGQDEGIFANYEGLDALKNQSLGMQMWQTITMLAMPVIYVFLCIVMLYHKKWGSDVAFQRKRKALARAKQRLQAAKDLKDEQLYAAKLDAIRGYVADRFNLNEQALVSGELLGMLKKELSAESYGRLQSFLELCESVRYGVVESSTDIAKITSELLNALHVELS
ncbi:BatD family protein [Candidatus Uabimicrobium amorphum]|uniref:Protein BatD n=1 Tax=Uabimicrobium amorphum TaxID=2596890 RepID=A0A5S9F2M2_UABAM|nr:BatD family protein [Candidatus Uabimicrobium amorphum]BBM83612.1 hypothetical protein UABAM_01965 [Candidatus Uabimicrobium amorphum]